MTGQPKRNKWSNRLSRVGNPVDKFTTNFSKQTQNTETWRTSCLNSSQMSYRSGSLKERTRRSSTRKSSSSSNSTASKCSLGSPFSTDSRSTKSAGSNSQPRMKMPATLATRTNSCCGEYWNGSLKMWSSHCSVVSSTALRSKKNTRESFTTAKQSGQWWWKCQLKT